MKKKEETENHILSRLDAEVASVLSTAGVKRAIVGISGGADSVALLHALLRTGTEVEAIHCNFHLRGEESNRDESFVRELCQRLEVPLEVVDFDVEAYREEHGGSVEMACRELRYDYFNEKKVSTGAARIAVAHNSDDNAETVLLNLFRGAGIAGLRAMKQDTDVVIRPLLAISRAEIEEYLRALDQPYVTDSTNLSSDYRRNFIRNEVLPLIEREWPDVKRSLNRTSWNMAAEEEGAEGFVGNLINGDILPYNRLDDSIQGRWLLRKFVTRKGGSDHIVKEISRSIAKGDMRKGARWKTPEGMFVMGFEGLEWVATEALPDDDMTNEFSCQELTSSAELLDAIKTDRSNRVFWTSLSIEELEIRRWREGDRIKPLGMKGSRLVSDIIREGKLPAKERMRLAVIEHHPTGEILWVEGLKRSGKGLVSLDSASVMRIQRK